MNHSIADLHKYHNSSSSSVEVVVEKPKKRKEQRLDLTIQLYVGGLSVIGLLILYRLLHK